MSAGDSGNFISEWFGHRIYPTVVPSDTALRDQRDQRCPFLSQVKGSDQECVKTLKSKGVCTVSACSNGPRQDWVACPYRMFDPRLIETVAARLYGSDRVHAIAGPRLGLPEVQAQVLDSLRSGKRMLVYFDQKIGGEVSVSATAKSPEMALNVTLVELVWSGGAIGLGRFAILEVQTMDFHGSYGAAVGKLKNGLELHRTAFPKVLKENIWWAGDGVEGPNIANVFKRTFYQMMFKFNFGMNESCAGTALVISSSVWDSWQPFLAAPRLVKMRDGTARLAMPGRRAQREKVPAWIYVFDFEANAGKTPSPTRIRRAIGLSADALGYYALKVAPEEASRQLVSEKGIYATLTRRLHNYWPEQDIKLAL